MTKNPLINAASATGYILLIAAGMNLIMQTQRDKPDTIAAPITVMSVLTLSVTVMAFIFFYQPLQLFIDGKKKAAVTLFVQTMGAFGAITAVVLALLFSGVV